MTPKQPPTVAEELAHRHDCRYGLKGAAVRLRDRAGFYRIASTQWVAAGRLLLAVYPDGQPPPATREWCAAADATLVEDWPVACCRPRRRHPVTPDPAAPEATRDDRP